MEDLDASAKNIQTLSTICLLNAVLVILAVNAKVKLKYPFITLFFFFLREKVVFCNGMF